MRAVNKLAMTRLKEFSPSDNAFIVSEIFADDHYQEFSEHERFKDVRPGTVALSYLRNRAVDYIKRQTINGYRVPTQEQLEDRLAVEEVWVFSGTFGVDRDSSFFVPLGNRENVSKTKKKISSND